VVCDAAAAERALQELGPEARNVSIILDAANLYRPPLDPRVHCSIVDDAVVRLGQHISLAHAKDIADPFKTSASDVAMGHYTHVAAGTGILPYEAYLAALTRTPAAIAAAANGSRLPLILHGLQHEQVPTAVTFLLELLRAPCPA
jgi:sugar phosphate isomerase/epimerase